MKHPKSKCKAVCVGDIADWLESAAPSGLAEEWDNCGLQVGSLKKEVRKIWIALDPLGTVIDAAVAQDVDLLITHHPLIMRPLARLDLDTPAGRSVAAAIGGRLTIFSVHTNLDSASDGLNDILGQRIGMDRMRPLVPAAAGGASLGLGRIGRLNPPRRVGELALAIKERLHTDAVRIAGAADMIVRRAAVCSGGGSSLLEAFLASDAQVYISGDLRYHNARDVEAAGRAMIDIGHFPSEYIVVEDLTGRLRKFAQDAGWAVEVEACRLERDPFVTL